MNSSLRRAVAATTAGATALVGTIALTAVVSAPAHAGRTVTDPTIEDYGFAARAFGSNARVDALGLSSGRSAPSYLGCTRRTGIREDNHLAAVADEGQVSEAIRIGAIDNVTGTFKNGSRVGSSASATVADLRLGMLGQAEDGTPNPHILIRGLRSTARAWVDKKTGKFGGAATFKSVEIVPQTGTPLDDILGETGQINDLIKTIVDPVLNNEVDGKADNVLTLPGLGEITLGNQVVNKRSRVVKSNAVALRVTLFGPDMTENTEDDVEVRVGRARAFVYRDVPAGIMRGSSHPVEAKLLGGLLSIGKVAHMSLPCNGTDGKVKWEAVADANFGNADQLEIGAARAEVFGFQSEKGSARAWTEAKVGRIRLGGAEGLEIRGPIVGRATVKTDRRGRIVKRSIDGSSMGEVFVDGVSQGRFGPGDVEDFEIPGGVVKVEFFRRDQSKRGLKVTALRLTLLDVDENVKSVIDLGVARAYITRT